jgi:hypothetical protein
VLQAIFLGDLVQQENFQGRIFQGRNFRRNIYYKFNHKFGMLLLSFGRKTHNYIVIIPILILRCVIMVFLSKFGMFLEFVDVFLLFYMWFLT